MGNYWTDLLTNYDIKKLVERMLFSLEYKYLTHNIKTSQKEAKMSYSLMFNSIIAGIFFPEEVYSYGSKSYVKQLRQKLGLTRTAVLADYISSGDMYKIIHTLHKCSDLLISNRDFGWNAKMFAYHFNKIGKAESLKKEVITIDPDSVFLTEKIKGIGLTRAYKLSPAKTLIRHVKKEGTHIAMRSYTKEESNRMFSVALDDYKNAKAEYDRELAIRNLPEAKRKKLTASLDSGFYEVIVPFYGHDITSIFKHEESFKYVSRRELLGHARKFERAKEVLMANRKTPLVELSEKLENAGVQSREVFIRYHKAYPEHTTGFYNGCIEMFADKNMKFDETALVESGLGMSTPYILKKSALALHLLAKQYEDAKTDDERQEIEKQAEKAQVMLQNSNEHSI